MKTKYSIPISFIVLLTSISSCEKGIEPTPGQNPNPALTPSDFGSVVIAITDFDQVKLTHTLGAKLSANNINGISVGYKDTAGFVQLAHKTAAYHSPSAKYEFEFDFSVKLDSTRLVAPLSIRYYFTDSNIADFDTTVSLYKYPYASTKIIVTKDALPPSAWYIQDIDRLGSKLYFHPLGPFGMYEYGLTTQQTAALLNYNSGDHIAADSTFVFCDINHREVHRFNLITNSVDLVFDLPPTIDISGLEAYENHVYILLRLEPQYTLRKYTYDGHLVDSVIVSSPGYYLSIYDGVLFMNDGAHISRFDLATKHSLPNLRLPGSDILGMKIIDNELYFSHYLKVYIGSVPIADLQVM